VDIGKVGDVISKEDAERFGMYQAVGNAMNGQVGGQQYTNLFSSFGGSATAAYQVPRGSIRASDDFYARLRIKDANANQLRLGGRRVEGIPMDQEGAVVGGYSSRSEMKRINQYKQSQRNKANARFMGLFGGEAPTGYMSRGSMRGYYSSLSTDSTRIRTALTKAGISYKTTGENIVQYNKNQYIKAGLINMLSHDFGVPDYIGSILSLANIQNIVSEQDQMIKSIGLDRTEAFQIVDTSGRGREEIDDRIRFKDRLSSMSTGVSVL
jgi:hypothetical protein